jgi:hypothetical protein
LILSRRPVLKVSEFELMLKHVSLLALGLMLVGCSEKPQSNYDGLGLVPVSGVVTLDSQPLAGAVVTFDAPDGQFAYGLTDEAGKYTLRVDSIAKGCPRGSRLVRVSTSRKILGLNSTEEGGEPGENAKPPEPEKVPGKFNKDSTMTVEVTPDKTTYDLELKST